MRGKKIYFILLAFSFLIFLGVVGYYFYSTYLKGKNIETSNTSQVSQTQPSTSQATLLGVVNGGGGVNISGCIDPASCYSKSTGGVDDYNNGGSIPSDTYHINWRLCYETNEYCGTKDSFADKQDVSTGLVWSKMMSVGTWFFANNCKYPNMLPNDDSVCNTNGEAACICIKRTEAKTGCESIGDGKWRLPYQKELLLAYINGIREGLESPEMGLWSATTRSISTERSWVVYVHTGSDIFNFKADPYNYRCVR